MRPNGSNPVNLTNNWAMDQQPNWSPDGRKNTMQANGSHSRRLTAAPGFDGDPNWSPDGRDGQFDVFRMRADGSRVVNLTAGSADFNFAPDWQPLP